MEVRVLFEGSLDKCTVEHGKKDWKRRHFVFKHILASNIRSLEFYPAGTKNWRKAEPKGVLALYPGYEVLKVHESRRHFVFEIKTIDHTYRLAAHSEDELNQWILILERESIVNSFCVDPEASEQMAKLGASDTCHLHVANNELRLFCAKDGRLLVAWPFTCLRRYMSARGKFTVEAGRRAPTGEGKFTFLTPQHDEVYKLLDNVIKSRAEQKPNTTKSHHPLDQVTKASLTDGGKDAPHNGYDHVVATSPRKDYQMSPESSNSMVNTYAAPYGHLPPRDAMKTVSPIMSRHIHQAVPDSRLTAESDVSVQYNTLNHPVQGFKEMGSKGVDDSEYCTLDQHLSPSTEGQDMYNTAHHGNFQAPMASQHPVMEDAYNVLGEAIPHVLHSEFRSNEENSYNTLHMTKNQISSTSSQLEQSYNTLDHAAPVRPPRKPMQPPPRTRQTAAKSSPKPLARKLSSDNSSKLQASPAGEDDMYNTLDTKVRPLPPRVRRIPAEANANAYDTLETSIPRHPPPPPVRKAADPLIKKHPKSQHSADEDDDMYNTLDYTKAGSQSPVITRRMQTFHTSTGEEGEMYNTLEAAGHPTPPSRITKQSSQSADGDEMYNTLHSTRGGGKPIAMLNEQLDNLQLSNQLRNDQVDEVYNTLDTSRTGASISAPVPGNAGSPLHSPVKKDPPTLVKKNSTSSLQSFRCPLDVPALQPEISQKASSLDDLDSYTSINYTALSPPKCTQRQFPIPSQRTVNAKGVPFKGRKSSAPDIILMTKTKDATKGGKSGLVLNLRASLEAGGLNFTKPRRKTKKKLSREESSEELPPHTEVEERGVTPTEDVFYPGTPPVKTGRSTSSPPEPNNRENIYDELNQSEPRPKSLQITKPMRSPKKV